MDPKALADIIWRNIATSDITMDEVEQIVRFYIKLYNRLYAKSIDVEDFTSQTMLALGKKLKKDCSHTWRTGRECATIAIAWYLQSRCQPNCKRMGLNFSLSSDALAVDI